MKQNTVFNQHTEKSTTQVNITSQKYFQIAQLRSTLRPVFPATSQNVSTK
jgi:hypothetical protein